MKDFIAKLIVLGVLMLAAWFEGVRGERQYMLDHAAMQATSNGTQVAEPKQQAIGRKIGQIEFQYAHRTFLMDEYVLGGSESDWPSVACVSTIGDRNHRQDRSLEFGQVRIYPITTIDLK